MKNLRSRFRTTFSLAGLALLATIVDPGLARGQSAEPTSEVETPVVRDARASFVRGTALAKETRWDDALDAFRRSYELRPHPITSYNLGYCERAMGRYTRAYKMLQQALREDATAADGRLPEKLVQSANRYLGEIESRLARVAITLGSATVRILVDGRPLDLLTNKAESSSTSTVPVLLVATRDAGPAELAPAPRFSLLLDPGTHVFVVSIPGAPESVRTEHFEAGSRASLALAVPTDSSPARAAAPRSAPIGADRALAGRQWAYATVGVGGASLAVGTIAGIAALRKRSALIDLCGPNRDACPPGSERQMDALGQYADLSTIALAVGGVGVIAGVGALFFLREKRGEPETGPSISATVGFGSAGLSGRF